MPRISARLAARIERAEAARAPASVALPHVLHLRHGETKAEALARLYGNVSIPKGHVWMCVPERVTDANRAEFNANFKANQLAFIADANREISELRRTAQEAGASEINPVAAAYARHRIAAKSNPYRKDQ